jgi:hypothetical protein
MASFVTFNGVTKYRPGGITRVRASSLEQITPSENGIIALIGESEGGAPGLTTGLVTHNDPTRAISEFRSGALVDAARLAFQSSNDPDVPGGASAVLLYKTNQSTQATLTLPTEEASFVAGTLDTPLTATGGSVTTVIDTTDIGTLFADDELNGKFLVLRPFTGTVEVRPITDFVSSTDTITVDPAFSGAAIAADEYLILENEVYNVSAATATGTTVTWVNGGLTADAEIGRWLHIQVDETTTYLRRITDNEVGTITVDPALPTIAAGAYAQILPNAVDLTTRDYGAHTNNVNIDLDDGASPTNSLVAAVEFEGLDETSQTIGGVPFLKVLYKGGANVPTVEGPVASGTTASTIEFTGGQTVDAHVGEQFYSEELNEFSTVISNTASAVTISPAFSAVPTLGTTVAVRTVTEGTMTVVGSAGVATSLTTTITGVTGDNLNVAFTAGMTVRQLATAINANTNYVATIPNGINGDVLLAADFDFGPNSVSTVLNSPNIATTGLMQNNVALVNYFENISELVTAVRSTGGALDGRGAPKATALPVSFTGGTRGISANSNFQAGFDALLLARANSVIPLIDEDLVNEGNSSTATWAAVAAQLGAHVAAARGASQEAAGERGGFIGFRGTRTAIVSAANSINNMDIAITVQNPTTLNSAGDLEEFGPRIYATMAASMRAGGEEIGTPLTHKYIRVSEVTQDASWEPQDTTDSTALIQAGVLFSETVDGKGTRWVRDLTTHVQDDNLAHTEGSVRDCVRSYAYGLRTNLVDKFIGKKAKPATISNVKDVVLNYSERRRSEGVIVDSTDLTTGATIRAYHNITVTATADRVTVNVGIFPVPGINFILNDIFVRIPSQSA